MPGAFTHIYAQRGMAKLLAGNDITKDFIRPVDGALLEPQVLDPDGRMLGPAELAKAMADWPKFAALGAIGPDMFFFLQDYASPDIPCDEVMLGLSLLYYLDDQGRLDDPYEGLVAILGEINSTWAGILRLIIKLDTLWKKFVDKWNETVGPIMDKAGQVADDLAGGLLSELGDAFNELKNDLMAVGAEEVLTEGDIFSWFSLKMREGCDEQSFLWSDMLHYRRTGRVPQRLFAHARALLQSGEPIDREHGSQLLAYASGWVTHVGTDTVAHPFVNQQTGGPFRTHWQRHHLVENHLCAYNYQCTGDGQLPGDDFIGWQKDYPSLNKSALYFAVQIPQGIDGLKAEEKQGDLRRHPLPDGDDRQSSKQRDEMLDTDGALPGWLAAAIVKALVEVYADPKEGGLQQLQEEPAPRPRNLLGQPFQDGLGDGAAILGRYLGKLGVDNGGQAFSDLLKAVAPDTPDGVTVPPGFPLPWEIQAAYRFLLSYYKRTFFSLFDMDKPRRPEFFTPPASDFDFGPPDFSGVSSSDPPLEQACEVIAALLDWTWKTLEKAGQAAYDVGKSIASGATLPPREDIYNWLVLPAWQVCENARQVLVHLAYLMPQSGQLYDDNGELKKPSEIDLEVITLGHTVDGQFAAALAAAWDVLGNLDHDPALTADTLRNPKSADYPWLPVRATGLDDIAAYQAWLVKQVQSISPNSVGDPRQYVVEFRRPWGFPDRTDSSDPAKAGNRIETPLTISGPYPLGTMPPTLLSVDALPADSRRRSLYEQSSSPGKTDSLNTEYIGHQPFTKGYPQTDKSGLLSGTNPLGGPILYSAYLLGQIANNQKYSANFNLDGDRGFGYLCWDWIRGDGLEKNPRGQQYSAPLVWPEGAGAPKWQPAGPAPAGQEPGPEYLPSLKLRYPGRPGDTGTGPEGGPN